MPLPPDRARSGHEAPPASQFRLPEDASSKPFQRQPSFGKRRDPQLLTMSPSGRVSVDFGLRAHANSRASCGGGRAGAGIEEPESVVVHRLAPAPAGDHRSGLVRLVAVRPDRVAVRHHDMGRVEELAKAAGGCAAVVEPPDERIRDGNYPDPLSWVSKPIADGKCGARAGSSRGCPAVEVLENGSRRLCRYRRPARTRSGRRRSQRSGSSRTRRRRSPCSPTTERHARVCRRRSRKPL